MELASAVKAALTPGEGEGAYKKFFKGLGKSASSSSAGATPDLSRARFLARVRQVRSVEQQGDKKQVVSFDFTALRRVSDLRLLAQSAHVFGFVFTETIKLDMLLLF